MSRTGELAMERHGEAVERRARELCIAEGLDPNTLCWDGDPNVHRGTRTWRQWQEFAERAEEELRSEDTP